MSFWDWLFPKKPKPPVPPKPPPIAKTFIADLEGKPVKKIYAYVRADGTLDKVTVELPPNRLLTFSTPPNVMETFYETT